MPIYEGIGLISEKHAVVIDLGSAYTKCGFAGETGPRCIVPSVVNERKQKKMTRLYDCNDADLLYKVMSKFIHNLYFKHLLVSPKDRRVLVVESVMATTFFRETLAKVLFQHFEVSSVLFVPAHLMALFTLGLTSALVLDVGYEEALAVPIAEGVSMINHSHSVPFAGKAIHKRLEELLMKAGTVRKDSSQAVPIPTALESISESTLEDIKVRACFVTKLDRAKLIHEAHRTNQPDKAPPSPHSLEYPMDGDHILIIPGFIREQASEVLFEQDGEQVSVATLILDTIIKCPVDVRKVMAENIILQGGTTMLPGFKHRLLTELHTLIQSDKYREQLALRTFTFHHPPAKENYTAWLGAAIFGATDAVTTRSVTRDQYQQMGSLPDWSNLSHRLAEEKAM